VIYSSKNIVILSGLCVDVINNIIENEVNLTMFKQATTNGIVCLNGLKDVMMKRIKKCYVIKNLLTTCPFCKCNRCNTIVRHCLNTIFNISCDRLSRYLNQLSAINTITLSMVKLNLKKNKAILSNNSVQTNSGQWTVGKCQEFLKTYGAPVGGLKNELQERCVLVLKLSKKKLDFI